MTGSLIMEISIATLSQTLDFAEIYIAGERCTLAKLFSIKSTELGALVCVTKNLIDLQERLIKEEKQKCSFL